MGSQNTSGKTFADIIDEVRSDVNDYRTPYFADDGEMLDWLNQAHAQAAKDSSSIQDTETIDLVANQLEYAVTSKYYRLHAVLYVNSASEKKALIKGSPSEVGHIHDVLEPVKYYEFDGKIGVYPTLSSITTETVEVYLSKRVEPDKALTDTIETPAMLDNALVWYVSAMWDFKRKKYSAHAQSMARFEAEIYKARTEFFPGFDE
jgi:hypothetical protein